MILVTGGTGFIGSNLVKRLVGLGYNVWTTGTVCERKPPVDCEFFVHGLTGVQFARMATLLHQQHEIVDVVFHEAANNDTTCTDEEEMRWHNVLASQKLFEWAIAHGCRKIVYASSTAVYGDAPAPQREDGPTNPLNAYGGSKLELEQLAGRLAKKHPEVTFVGLRYCNTYGPGEKHKGKRASMIYQMGSAITRRPIQLFGDGEQKRDWIYVDDVIRANLMAMEAEQSCVVNCGSGTAVTFNEIYNIIAELMNKPGWGGPHYIPNPHGEKYQAHIECDMTLANQLLGFVPKYDIQVGIIEMKKHLGFD